MADKKLKKLSSDSTEMERLRLRNQWPWGNGRGGDEGLRLAFEIKPVYDLECFKVFPEEIWLEILNKLTNSEDIRNVLKAFPVLDQTFQNKKAYWLFDQVLPHLLTKYLVFQKNNDRGDYVDSKELLKLRLISKRWKRIVDVSIQNHAERHPISSENGKQSLSAAVALPVNHFNHYRINKYHLGATVFHTAEQITNFIDGMANFQGNPFPGKYVFFELGIDSEDFVQDFVMKAVELLLKFGHHVLVLSWEIGDGTQCHLEMCKSILRGLSSVPNLQSLKISGYLNERYEATDEFFREPENLELFPKLENLECFDWQVETNFERSSWVDHIIYLFCGKGVERNGLRKLALDHKYWNAEMSTNLENLTELHLLLDEEMEYNIDEIKNVLRMFPIGQLKKFSLSDYVDVKENREIYIDELIEMLAEFKIENVVFENLNLKEKMSEIDASGITSIHLDDSLGLSYEFLKRLPDLRFLSVHVPFDVVDKLRPPPSPTRDDGSLAFKVRKYFWKIDDFSMWIDGTFDIWKECGKLENLTASVSVFYGFKFYHVQFMREYGNKPFFGGLRWGKRDG